MRSSSIDTKFRQDINGMRAIAVIGVIAFHFKLGVLRAGGFAGVDVFFVISGFLMTQIIVGRLDRSRFSLRDFLMARVRRIVPAFVVLVVAVLLAGFLLLNPLRYQVVAERAAWTLSFASNILFARQGFYFVAPEQNWLLHTWSLSVEAQFYLVFPLILMLLRRTRARRGTEAAALLAVALASFAVMTWSASAGGGDGSSYNFYMLWSRAWEFLVGALCVYAAPFARLGARPRIALHYAGMAAIFLAMMVFHNTTPWPSPPTALPVLGTAAMLLARHEDPAWARLAPVRSIGLWSYSLYLWHWPIAAASASFGQGSLPFRLVGVAASVGLGMASYVLVERSATNFLWRSKRRVRGLALPSFVLAMAFALASQTSGFEAERYAFRPRVLAKLQDFRAAHADWLPDDQCGRLLHPAAPLDECRYGNPRADDVLVVGDSFAAQLRARYKDLPATGAAGLAFVTRHGCVPISRTTEITFDAGCDPWTAALYPWLARGDFRRVVFLAYWPVYAQGRLCLMTEPNCGLDLDPESYGRALDAAYRRLADLWRTLKARGKDVVVFDVTPYAGPPGDPMVLYEKVADGEKLDSLDIAYDAFALQHRDATRRLATAVAYAGATLVDPAAALCPTNECPIVRNWRPLYMDAIHLRASMMDDPRFTIFDRYLLPPSSAARDADAARPRLDPARAH